MDFLILWKIHAAIGKKNMLHKMFASGLVNAKLSKFPSFPGSLFTLCNYYHFQEYDSVAMSSLLNTVERHVTCVRKTLYITLSCQIGTKLESAYLGNLYALFQIIFFPSLNNIFFIL